MLLHRKENNNIFVDDLKEEGEKRPIPNPCRTFLEAFQPYPEIMENIERVGFAKPTPIQVSAQADYHKCHPKYILNSRPTLSSGLSNDGLKFDQAAGVLFVLNRAVGQE